MSYARRFGGYKAKKIGASWEETVKHQAQLSGWTVIRIPDGCRQVGREKLIRVRTPFDFVMIKNGKTLFFDCKTINDDKFSHSHVVPHQINILADISRNGGVSGYLIYFQKTQKIFFYFADVLRLLPPYQSLGEGDGIDLGTLTFIAFEKIFWTLGVDFQELSVEPK